MEQKETTKEKKEEFAKMQQAQMADLVENSMIIGANTAKKWDKQGSHAADFYFNKGEGFSQRQEIYEQMKNNYEKNGINYEPQFPGIGMLVSNSMNIVNGANQVLTLGNLEKIVNQVHPGKDFKVIDKFKNVTGDEAAKLIEKDPKKLTEYQKDLLNTYVNLISSYQKGAPLSFMIKYSLAEENASGKEIWEKYNKPKENKEKSK